MRKVGYKKIIKELRTSLEIANRTPLLRLPEVLPAESDLEEIRKLAGSLLDCRSFYMSNLLSAKYSGETLSDEMIAAMKKAGIDPEKTSKESKPMEIYGVSFAELDLNEEKRKYGSC